jgi:hypothetical protein
MSGWGSASKTRWTDERVPLPRTSGWAVSVEDQARADERVPAAAGPTPAADYVLAVVRTAAGAVAGGESGPGARPMHPDWARALRDQCAAAQVPFLFKQWGVDWALAEDCAAKALAKVLDTAAAAAADKADALNARASHLTAIHRRVQLRRQSIDSLNRQLRAQRQQEHAA